MGAPGGFYRYEVKTPSDWRWRRVLMFRLPTPEPIPGDQFRRVTDTYAYFFHDNIFGLTTDAGATWSFQGSHDHPSIVARQPLAHIESAVINPDGTGVMHLCKVDPLEWEYLPSQALATSDFGRTWKEP
ncbi:MAG: hypothetical protein HQ582_34320 [Planctomycetes bacterium]|nr:hypothetical protein [Planctomycetota bacterium]